MSISFHPLPHGVTWASFREVLSSPNGHDAQTGYALNARFKFRGNDRDGYSVEKPIVTVSLTRDTWVVKGRKNAALLRHEQLHYIIATLVGRELDAELGELTAADTGSLQQDARDLMAAKTDRALAIGGAYDDDTDHSQNAVQQASWALRVHDWEHNGSRVQWP